MIVLDEYCSLSLPAYHFASIDVFVIVDRDIDGVFSGKADVYYFHEVILVSTDEIFKTGLISRSRLLRELYRGTMSQYPLPSPTWQAINYKTTGGELLPSSPHHWPRLRPDQRTKLKLGSRRPDLPIPGTDLFFVLNRSLAACYSGSIETYH